MRLDIYKRPENGGQYSYLAVPEGKEIPQEATNIDWEAAERSIDFDENNGRLAEFSIDDPLQQINAKGYAITSVKNLAGIDRNG
ncbi:MAG: hypothetical protein A3I66_06460 [Burkholderiales bacterium RIFCSPLOWO2_02_FULL_57_36]|nr:MAG: hypothetical protein A3I66_06460 [Burkholderiales bacterium RIFCSPLOWO2_02_FULL_57_36]